MPAQPPDGNWRRVLWLMVALQIAMSLSFAVSGPFLPLLIGELGVTPPANVELWSGFVTAIYALSAALLSPFWGALADRTGRKSMVVRSCLAACLFNGLAGFSQNVYELFAVRAVAGFFGGFSVASMALVGTQVPEGRLGFALGWMATGQLLGNLLGPLLGGVLADWLHDYRAVFFWTSAGALACSLLCIAFVREHREAAPQGGRPIVAPWVQFARIARHPSILPLFGVVMLAQVAARGVTPIVPLYVQSLVGASPWLGTFAGAAMAVTGIADVIASPWLGKRSDTLGYRRVLTISLIGAALFTLPQGIAANIWLFLALRFGVGVFLGGILPAANAWVGRLFASGQRGQVYGITASAQFLGGFVGPLASGLIAARFGFGAVFATIAVVMLGSVLLVARGTRDAVVLDTR